MPGTRSWPPSRMRRWTVADDTFEEIARRLDYQSPLMGAFRAAEQWYEKNHTEYMCADVVRRAWDQLDMAQQHEAMDVLFNAFWHMVMANRKWLELDSKEPDGNTYLEHGDLEVIEHTLDGAAAMAQFGAIEDRTLDEIFPDGMIPVHVDQLRRIISEVELLQHRLKMRDGAVDR